jgi:VanZ family protein
MRRLLLRWGPPLLWMGLIFVASAQPELPSAHVRWLDILLKKAGHGLGYGVLGWLYLRALRNHCGKTEHARFLSVGMAAVYALTDEYHQRLVPGRNGALYDVAVDAVGAGLAATLDWWWEEERRPQTPTVPAPDDS